MVIPERLLQYRYHFAVAITASAVLSLFLYAAPRLITILAYFWPLFASTAVFLILIVVFGGTVSHLAADSQGEKEGEGLLDYVAEQPEYAEQSQEYG
ncbi:Microtubule-associated protein [Salix suchowensis]|nr:Microtubule-associated protein [Salix suchowensis]KAG5242414.1 Microtubule-associated protein [Salix suchowensis]